MTAKVPTSIGDKLSKGVRVGWDDEGKPMIRFTHELFDIHSYEEIPCDQEIYLVSDEYLSAFEQYWLNAFLAQKAEDEFPWFVTFAAAREILRAPSRCHGL